jgi:hypothetical protein
LIFSERLEYPHGAEEKINLRLFYQSLCSPPSQGILADMRPRTFIQALLKTFTDVRYYRDVLQAPFSFSLRFFILATISLGLTRAVYVNYRLVPTWRSYTTAIVNELERDFPSDLEITWNGRTLSTNQDPTEVPYPQVVQPQPDSLPPVLGYLTSSPVAPDSFSTHFPQRSLLVATQDTLYVSDSQGAWSDVPLSTVPGFDRSFTLSRQTLPTFIETARQEITQFWSWAQGMLVILSAGYVLLSGLWVAALEGLFAYFILRFSGLKITYGKAVQLAFHLVIVAEALSQVVLWVYGPVDIPIFSITFWCLFAYVVLTLRSELLPTPRSQE